MNKIRIQRIYDEIIKEQGWEPYKDSKARLLRNKFTFLMRNVMLCEPESLKNHGKIEIPEREAPIIKNLLVKVLDDESMVSAWFNGSVDLSVSENTILLFLQLKEPIMRSYMQGLTDEVTMDEWLASIDAAIDFTNAQKTCEMKRLLENLRAAAKPLNHTIHYGDVIMESEDGSRRYALHGNQKEVLMDDNLIHQIMDYVATEKDYFDILNILIAKFIDDAKSTSYEDIFSYALAKSVMDDGDKCTARDICNDSIASEYVQRFRNIYEFLKNEPQIVKEIENKAGTTGLLEFFNVAGGEYE